MAIKKTLLSLLLLSALGFMSCGGAGGGISGSPDQPKQPVSVNVVETSETLETGDTFQFHASVSNATNTTLTWTVNDVVGGNSTVGTMSVDGLYTAPTAVPSPSTVTLKATSNADTTKFDTATVTISPRFAISPKSATVTAGQTQQFTANEAVDNWQVNNIMWGSSAVGTITSSGLYTAPASVPSPNPVTVKAIKLGDGTKNDTAAVTIIAGGPKPPTISPGSATVPAGGTQQFTADMAVNWEADGATGTDPSTWGTISSAGLYTAPLSPPWTGQVNIKATAKSDTTLSANAVVTVVFSNASLNGHYAFRFRGVDNAVGTAEPVHIWAVGSFVADGKGGISGGSADLNLVNVAMTAGGPATAPFTGTYSIAADGRASATFTLPVTGESQSIPLRWVMISNTAARMVGFDDTGSGWGSIDMQDPSSFPAGLSGTYVFSYDGLNNASHPYAAAGMFTADAGAINSGLGDFNDQLGVRQVVSLQGSYTGVDASTGRGTWNYTDGSTGYTWSFAYYLLNSSSFVFSSTDDGFGFLGVAVQQDTSNSYSISSLSGNAIFMLTGYSLANGNTFTATWAGLLAADGNGQFTSGVVDDNINGTIEANLPYHGSYSIDANGHGTASITGTNSVQSHPLGLYMTGVNNGFWVSLDSTLVTTGQFMPQATGTYDSSTLRKSFALAVRASYTAAADDMAGQMTLDGAGSLAGKADVNAAGLIKPDTSFTGTYTVSDNGRGQVAINNGSSTTNYAMYLVSGRTGFLVPIDSGGQPAFGLVYRQF